MAVTAVAASAVATVVESGGDTAVMQERWQLLKFETLKCEPDGQGVHVRVMLRIRHNDIEKSWRWAVSISRQPFWYKIQTRRIWNGAQRFSE